MVAFLPEGGWSFHFLVSRHAKFGFFISHPWPRRGTSYPPTWPWSPSWSCLNLKCLISYSIDSYSLYMPNLGSLSHSHGLEQAPVIHRPGPGHFPDVCWPYHFWFDVLKLEMHFSPSVSPWLNEIYRFVVDINKQVSAANCKISAESRCNGW